MQIGILIIDDEEGIRRSLSRVLREEGYSIRSAKDGEEAIALFQQDPHLFDIIICDLIMPGIDGIKTIEELNKLNQETTKIILTGYGTLESSIKAIETGVDGYITKPFENKELKWKIKEYYVKRKMKQFISPAVFNQLLLEPLNLQPRISRITILFTDIRGFTHFSSTTSPETLASLMNKHYFHPLSEIIKQYNGMVDKYIGDSIMALFGAPVHMERHEENAVLCAKEMMDTFEQTGKGLGMGIGISTGSVVTGVFGSISKREYTALGMPVNIAARLQKFAMPGDILISEDTRSNLDSGLALHSAGSLSVSPSVPAIPYYRVIRNGKI